MASSAIISFCLCITVIYFVLVDCRDMDNMDMEIVWKKAASGYPRGAIDNRDYRYGLTRIGKRRMSSSKAAALRDFRYGLTRIGKRNYLIDYNYQDY